MSEHMFREDPGSTAVLSAPDPGLQAIGPMTASTAALDLAVIEGTQSHIDYLRSSDAGSRANVASRVVGGTSALGLGVVIERGAGFLANILAARFGGTTTFGSYSLAISTANQISTYAAGGIGATAARFSGKYPYGTANYSTLARALAIVSVASAALAALALWFGAGPIAHLLGRQQLIGLLRWACLSAAGIILLECARGFFVGQRRLVALVLLSVLVGGSMILFLPFAAAAHRPTHMIVLQGAITSGAVLVCLLFSKPLGLHASEGASVELGVPLSIMLREVWSFGLVQLAGLIASNLAGWWLTTLVARADTSLVQMSFFAIASQLRNLVGIVPGLLTEGSYAVMADPALDHAHSEDADLNQSGQISHRVMALCSFASLTVSLLLAATGMVFVPWFLTLLYGPSYAPAGLTVALGLAIAVVHMGNAPAAARLTIVSIRSTGVINTVWAVFVAAAACLFFFFHGGAWQAMLIYFAGHVLSSVLVLATLQHKDHLPRGMVSLFLFSTAAITLLAALAFVRATHPELQISITALMFSLFLLAAGTLFAFGKHFQWLPSPAAIQSLMNRITPSFFRGQRHV